MNSPIWVKRLACQGKRRRIERWRWKNRRWKNRRQWDINSRN
jgi:hypothetical protein